MDKQTTQTKEIERLLFLKLFIQNKHNVFMQKTPVYKVLSYCNYVNYLEIRHSSYYFIYIETRKYGLMWLT